MPEAKPGDRRFQARCDPPSVAVKTMAGGFLIDASSAFSCLIASCVSFALVSVFASLYGIFSAISALILL